MQRGNGQRPLQRQQRHVRHGDDAAAAADPVLDVGDVARLAGAVHNDKQVAAVGRVAVDKHQVVNDAARFIQQQTVALLARRQVNHIHRHQAFKRCGCLTPDQAQLAHMRHVKQAGGAAGMQVFGHQACRVLHRHGVAGEWHHARAQIDVQIVQRRLEKAG